MATGTTTSGATLMADNIIHPGNWSAYACTASTSIWRQKTASSTPISRRVSGHTRRRVVTGSGPMLNQTRGVWEDSDNGIELGEAVSGMQHQVCDKREVIRGAARQLVGRSLDVQYLEMWSHKNMVEPAHWQEQRERAAGHVSERVRRNVVKQHAAVVSMPVGDKPAIEPAAGSQVEITEKHRRLMVRHTAEPFRTEQEIDLCCTLRGSETEMRAEQQDLLAEELRDRRERVARLDPDAAAIRQPRTSAHLERMSGKEAMAITFVIDLDRRAETGVHAQLLGEVSQLILTPRSASAAVELLNGHDVRVQILQHTRDSLRCEAAVQSAAIMHIVTDHADTAACRSLLDAAKDDR